MAVWTTTTSWTVLVPYTEAAVFEDASQYAEVVKNGYRKGYWYTQPYHVEVLG